MLTRLAATAPTHARSKTPSPPGLGDVGLLNQIGQAIRHLRASSVRQQILSDLTYLTVRRASSTPSPQYLSPEQIAVIAGSGLFARGESRIPQ